MRKITVKNGDWVNFVIPMPASWSESKKAKMVLKPHTSKPDVDNLLKALLDACFESDSHIHDIRATKMWGYTGCVEFVPF